MIEIFVGVFDWIRSTPWYGQHYLSFRISCVRFFRNAERLYVLILALCVSV